jgi:hypothetical protein
MYATACGGKTAPAVDMTVLCQVSVVHGGGSTTETRRYDLDGRLHDASYELRGDRSRMEKRTYDRAGRPLRVEIEDGENKYAPARRATYIEHKYEGGRLASSTTTEVMWKSLGVGRGFEGSPTVQRAVEEVYRYEAAVLVEVTVTTRGNEQSSSVDSYSDGRLVGSETRAGDGEVIARSAYEYDAAGMRIGEAYAECYEGACETVESVTFRHDGAGRLAAVVYERPDERESIAIAYDDVGRPQQETLIEGDGDEVVTTYRYTDGCGATAGVDRVDRLLR